MKVTWNSTFPWVHFVWNDVRTPPKEEAEVMSTPTPPKVTPVTPKPANVPTTKAPATTVPTPKPPVSTKVDMLTVMGSNIPGFCMSGTYDVLLTAPPLQLHVKNPIGFPVDVRYYDEHGVYDQQTEVNWQDPNFVKLHLANGGRGFKMCDRYVTSFPHQIINPDSPLIYVKNGQYDFYPENVGQTRYLWRPPVIMDWGEDVGKVLTYPMEFYWSDPKNCEYYFFAPPFGLVKWKHGILQADGTYKIDNDPPPSVHKQSLASWQKTLAQSLPGMKAFGYNVPFISPVKLPRGTY